MDSPAPSPHAEYDRWIARRERWGAWWRRFGQIAFYVVGGILAIAFAALLVASLIDLGQPRIWGTFTQAGCEERFRGGCRPYGTWVSDDGTGETCPAHAAGGSADPDPGDAKEHSASADLSGASIGSRSNTTHAERHRRTARRRNADQPRSKAGLIW